MLKLCLRWRIYFYVVPSKLPIRMKAKLGFPAIGCLRVSKTKRVPSRQVQLQLLLYCVTIRGAVTGVPWYFDFQRPQCANRGRRRGKVCKVRGFHSEKDGEWWAIQGVFFYGRTDHASVTWVKCELVRAMISARWLFRDHNVESLMASCIILLSPVRLVFFLLATLYRTGGREWVHAEHTCQCI